jgi:hypothetical protein
LLSPNGSLPPIGYRIVEAAEQHGHRIKKTLEIDPIQAETVRQIFRLAREGDGSSGPMGVKKITRHLNAAGIRTRDGGRWGIGAVHKVLRRTTYIGRHRFNAKFWKTRERKREGRGDEPVAVGCRRRVLADRQSQLGEDGALDLGDIALTRRCISGALADVYPLEANFVGSTHQVAFALIHFLSKPDISSRDRATSEIPLILIQSRLGWTVAIGIHDNFI